MPYRRRSEIFGRYKYFAQWVTRYYYPFVYYQAVFEQGLRDRAQINGDTESDCEAKDQDSDDNDEEHPIQYVLSTVSFASSSHILDFQRAVDNWDQ